MEKHAKERKKENREGVIMVYIRRSSSFSVYLEKE